MKCLGRYFDISELPEIASKVQKCFYKAFWKLENSLLELQTAQLELQMAQLGAGLVRLNFHALNAKFYACGALHKKIVAWLLENSEILETSMLMIG